MTNAALGGGLFICPFQLSEKLFYFSRCFYVVKYELCMLLYGGCFAVTDKIIKIAEGIY